MFLVGFMGAGKSSVGCVLAEQLNWFFEDLDQRIEQREGRRIAEIFLESGEPAFRKAERVALEQVLLELRGGSVRVVALGGGAFAEKGNATLLRQAGARTIFLDAPVDELWKRCCGRVNDASVDHADIERPLMKSAEQFRKLYTARRKSYLAASLTVDTANRTVEAIATEIAERLGLQPVTIRMEEGDME